MKKDHKYESTNPVKSHRKQSKSQKTATSSQKSDLQTRLEKKLQPSIFRMMNEKMYKNKIKTHKFNFDMYHAGYKTQVAKWPFNPLDVIIKYLQNCDYSIADFGCGEGKLEAQVKSNVISIDLNTMQGIKCDIRKTPIKDESLDVVVFCLSIMNSDGFEYIKEANRVCKVNGKMIIAELKNRMIGFEDKAKQLGFIKIECIEENEFFVVYVFEKYKECNGIKITIPMKVCRYKKR